MQTHVARSHNIFGPEGTWDSDRENAPAAICRKVAMARSGENIEVWGDDEQTRSFLYVDECVEGTVRLLRSNFAGLNIGSEEMVSINELVDLVADIAGKAIGKNTFPVRLVCTGVTLITGSSNKSCVGSPASHCVWG
jgi:GDP-D-mannose 3',5'-epimerase